jgi:AcrR family transcriptional regulator
MSALDLQLRTVQAPAVARRLDGSDGRDAVGAGQRMRLISATVALVSEHEYTFPTVTDIVSFAGVSRKTFYEQFADRSECLLAAIDHALVLSAERVRASYDRTDRWADGMRAGLAALLQFFDEEPQLARLCVVRCGAAGPAALARRGEALDELARRVDEGRVLARRQPPPLTAEAVVGGILSVITKRLVSPGSTPLIELVNPLTSAILLPYRGHTVARRELFRRVDPHPVPSDAPPQRNALEGLQMRLTNRTMAVLSAISAEPGLSNLQVSQRAGITDQGQISKLLARLSRLGLMENNACGRPRAPANEWRLTPRGQEVQDTIERLLRRPGPKDAAARPQAARDVTV